MRRPRPAPVLAPILLAAALATSVPGAAQLALHPCFSEDPTEPLQAVARRIAESPPHEEVPEPEEHYLATNERRHDLWFDHIRDLGGAYVGVGSDQTYTLAAVQNASMVFVVDYDRQIPLLHRLYAVLVPASDTPDALVARFSPAEEAATLALLEESLADDPERDAIVSLYRGSRGLLHDYLGRMKSRRWGDQGASWLADPVLYERTRRLFRAGRIVARAGDVTGETTLRAVGQAARQLGVPVRVFYLSNAEAFFPFSDSFQANVAALPVDERSVLLRTYRHPEARYPQRDTWAFMVEPMADFSARLANGYRRARQIVADAVRAQRRASGPAEAAVVVDERVPRRELSSDD